MLGAIGHGVQIAGGTLRLPVGWATAYGVLRLVQVLDGAPAVQMRM